MKHKKTRTFFIISTFVIVLLVVMLAFYFSTRVEMNPPGTIGNTAGNLNNSGLFCEQNGTVYFANPTDNGALYSMNIDETNVKKLNNLRVQNLLAAGKYLYYFQMGSASESQLNSAISTKSFCRSDQSGKNTLGLTHSIVLSAQLIDNDIYMLSMTDDGPVFSKIKIDKSDSAELAQYEINPSSVQNGVIYFNDTRDSHSLMSWDVSADTSREIWQGNLWYPIAQGDYVYYMDISENYRLCRYSLSQNVVEVLTNDRVDCYNIGNGYIYYQKNGDIPQLKCMRTDGSDNFIVAEGNFTDINMTSAYVYFRDFNNNSICYHSYIGSNDYSVFQPE